MPRPKIDKEDIDAFIRMSANGAFLALRGMMDMGLAARRMIEQNEVVPNGLRKVASDAELRFLRELKGHIDDRLVELERGAGKESEPVKVKVKRSK